MTQNTFTGVDIDLELKTQAKKWCKEVFGPAKPTKCWDDLRWYCREYKKLKWVGDIDIKSGSITFQPFNSKMNVTYSMPIYVSYLKFYFRDPQQATMFALKWSNTTKD